MRVSVRLFAQMRVVAGCETVEIDLAEGAPVSQAVETLARLHPLLREAVGKCMVAVGLDYASPDQILREADEVSLIPPVQGG